MPPGLVGRYHACHAHALSGRMAARAGLLDKWSQALEPTGDMVWRMAPDLYVENGRPPRASEIAACAAISEERVLVVLHKLQLRDRVGLEPGTDAIRYASRSRDRPLLIFV